MRKNILILLFVAFPLFLFAQSEAMKFKITEYDFGTIEEKGGVVSCVFEFSNQGKSPIIINAVEASCGCTTPVWTKEPVLPEKFGMVKATYNPINRPGKFAKSIIVKTNVGIQRLIVKGNVTPRPKSLSELYPKKMQGLRLRTSYVMFNEIGNKQVRNIILDAVNDSKDVMQLAFGKKPAYITLNLGNNSLKPNEKTTIEVQYDANKADFWGFNSDLIPLIVNGEKKTSNSLIVTATVIEDFSKMTKEELARAPILGVDKFESQFKSALSGDKIKVQFKLSNIGKSPLILRKIDVSSEDLFVKPSKTVIQPNTQEILDVSFDTSGKHGYQNHQITVITNAPDMPIASFRISGIVE